MIKWCAENWQTIALIATGTISVASIIVKLTPTKSDDKVVDTIIKILQVLSLYKKDK